MKPADSQLRKLASRTDVLVAIVTAIVVIVTTISLVLLLF